MVFTWLRNLERGLIRGTKRRGLSQPRRRTMASSTSHATPLTVETLEIRRMLTNPIAPLISEIMVDPPGANSPNQYVELRGTPNATLGAGTYLVGVSGDAGTVGVVQDIFDVSGKQFGSNGFLVLLEKGSTYSVNASATNLTNSGSGAGFGSGATSSIGHTGSGTDLYVGSETFFLITTGTAPTLATDIDADNNGTPDGAAFSSWTILDSVGILDGSAAGDFAYGQINFKNSAGGGVGVTNTVSSAFTPLYVARIETSTGYLGSQDWVAAGGFGGAVPNLTFSTSTSSPYSFNTVPINNIGSYNKWGNPSHAAIAAPILTNGSILAFTENGAAAAINTVVTVTDGDDGTDVLNTSGSVTITNFVLGEDLLSYTTTAGITGVVNNTTGVVTLTAGGGASSTSWQSALRAVKFQNTSDNPTTTPRTVVYLSMTASLAALHSSARSTSLR